MDGSSPGSSVYRILQASILKQDAISYSRGSSRSRDRTWVSCIAGGFFAIWATREDSMNPFSCSNQESLHFLVSKENIPKSGISLDGRGRDRETTKLVVSRLWLSPYVIASAPKIHPVTSPKYTTLNLGCTKIFIRVKVIPISNELYDSKAWIHTKPRFSQMHYFWWGSLTHALLFYERLVRLAKYSAHTSQGYWSANTQDFILKELVIPVSR